MANLIEVKNVGKRYERGGRPFWALRNATLAVAEGEFVTLLGRSGSGKSTLLNIIVGLLSPTEGEAVLCSTPLSGLTDEAASELRNRSVGYVPQGAGVLSTLTVLDNVRLPWYLAHRGPEPEGRAQQLLEEVGLGDLANQYPSALSGGELRRVAIARALMCEPKVIVADEPTSSLDAQTAREVVSIFRRLADKGTGVLMVTHDTFSVDVSDRLYDMAEGVLTERAKA
ncbi:ABC transporter ATP-binding protein [Sutterella massiliensis]|uniref:ABC transporter ATP-binding protein n=1 Tax=Sutterella massiliensis TaxID=1816689 RepID=A0ABS2DQM1_9BURK|nr:ABC transporter ATP-binding protein [Sutterella massiliensis]MBM6703584.1 ABC transporter ATP-binding protein [Sutterella massiliensis]